MNEAKVQEVVKNKVLVLGLSLATLMAVCLLLASSPAHATDFTVNSTADDTDAGGCQPLATGDCTLREAILAANSTLPADTINFNIPGAGVRSIVTSGLPPITRPLTINGYTQPGATENTLAKGTNARLLIEIDGSSADGTNGLVITGGNTTVRGLVINNFAPDNVEFEGGNGIGLGGTNNVIEGNFIGTNPAGTADEGNEATGVSIGSTSTGNRIGGASAGTRNMISGNGQNGVLAASSNNTIQGNLIGTDKSGKRGLGNSLRGLFLVTTNTDNNSITANTIAFNGTASADFNNDGLAIQDGATGNRISRNAIFANRGLGIDLTGGIQNQENAENVSANDPGDADTGPNSLQNFPVITSATATTIKGKLNSTPGKTFTIEFFSSPSADPSNFGEGQSFLGQTNVTTNSSGNAGFTFSAASALPEGHVVSATATNRDTGDTSEFSKAFPDATGPTVTRVLPAENSTLIVPSGNLQAFFSEEMDPATVNNTTFKVRKQGTTTFVAATVFYDALNRIGVLNPDANLEAGATYVATVTSGARDLVGNQLDQDPNASGNQPKVWRFTVRQ